MTPPPPFLFDLDGTLADTLADIAASTNYVRRLHGLPEASLDTVRSFVGDGARSLLRRALREVLPTDPGTENAGTQDPRAQAPSNHDDLLDRAFATYAEHHAAQCTRTVQLYPGVREHLQRLAAADHPLAVVTNKPERFAVPIVRHLGLHELLRVIVGGDTLPVRKPDPAPLRHALQQLGWAGAQDQGASNQVTMVGDGVQDLRAGKALGGRTIACLFGFGVPAQLRAEGADLFWSAFGEPA